MAFSSLAMAAAVPPSCGPIAFQAISARTQNCTASMPIRAMPSQAGFGGWCGACT
jgi:hypothetical protein